MAGDGEAKQNQAAYFFEGCRLEVIGDSGRMGVGIVDQGAG